MGHRAAARGIASTAGPQIKAHKMPPRPKVNEEEITETFIKGGQGPGGQKINKTNSKVQLKHVETGIVVTSQATRSREQNRKIAREILGMKLQHQEDPENSRIAALGKLKKQKAERRAKRSHKKYKAIDEERQKKKEEQKRKDEEDLQFLIESGIVPRKD